MHNGNYNTYLISRFVDEIDNNNIVKNMLPSMGTYIGDNLDATFTNSRYNRNIKTSKYMEFKSIFGFRFLSKMY